jgi:DNA adenine methylase
MLYDGDDRRHLPFLKWAGGKRWLATRYSHLVPDKYNTYIEPFLGSAAMFFALQPRRAVLSDLNRELIEAYRAIRSDWKAVAKALKKHHVLHSRDHYYRVRSDATRSVTNRAAKLIYLNRTCWNGLYRVNKRGEFNVPIGTKTRVCLPTDDFERIHKLLGPVRLVSCDFERVIETASAGDLVFADPPYTTAHSANGFIKYNETLFGWSDQIRLRDALSRARDRGAFIIATNANHPSIRGLYKDGFSTRPLVRSSVIAADPLFRQTTRELLITAGDKK